MRWAWAPILSWKCALGSSLSWRPQNLNMCKLVRLDKASMQSLALHWFGKNIPNKSEDQKPVVRLHFWESQCCRVSMWQRQDAAASITGKCPLDTFLFYFFLDGHMTYWQNCCNKIGWNSINKSQGSNADVQFLRGTKTTSPQGQKYKFWFPPGELMPMLETPEMTVPWHGSRLWICGAFSETQEWWYLYVGKPCTSHESSQGMPGIFVDIPYFIHIIYYYSMLLGYLIMVKHRAFDARGSSLWRVHLVDVCLWMLCCKIPDGQRFHHQSWCFNMF